MDLKNISLSDLKDKLSGGAIDKKTLIKFGIGLGAIILFLILSKKFKLSFVVVSLIISIEPIFFKYQPNNGIFRSSFLRIKIGYCKGAWSINVSSKDWCALATKNLSFFFKFSIPEKVTLTPNINLNKNIIILL